MDMEMGDVKVVAWRHLQSWSLMAMAVAVGNNGNGDRNV
jgi:hypothetical protein